MSPEEPVRIQKVLAKAGIASRRHSEQMIREGRVTLSGEPVTNPGVKIKPDQYGELRIDGERLPLAQGSIYIVLHKPEGFVTTTSDPQDRPTVLDLLPKGLPRLFPVGRLDLRSEGILLLTNDGPLTHLLLHPRFHVPKVYEVKVEGLPRPSSLRSLCDGIGSGKERMWAAKAEFLRRGAKNTWLLIEIRQGRHHQVRKMCESIGHPVLRLKRVSFGPIKLGGIPRGKWRLLRAEEVDLLRRWVTPSERVKKDGLNN